MPERHGKSGSASFQAIFHTSPSIFTKRCCKLVRDQLSIRAGNTRHSVRLESGSEAIQLSQIFTVCLFPLSIPMPGAAPLVVETEPYHRPAVCLQVRDE